MSEVHPHPSDRWTPEATPHAPPVGEVDHAPLWARFSDAPDGLLALEVRAPVPVVLALVDLLHRFGVHLTDFRSNGRDGWALQRFEVVESDGRAVRSARRLRLQTEVLTLLASSDGGQRLSPCAAHRPAEQDSVLGGGTIDRGGG